MSKYRSLKRSNAISLQSIFISILLILKLPEAPAFTSFHNVVLQQQPLNSRIILDEQTSMAALMHPRGHVRQLMGDALMDRPRAPSFEERMRNVVLGSKAKRRLSEKLPENVEVVRNLEDYRRIVVEEKERIVVVRFFASWCKACKAITPLFYRVARKCDGVLFVEVPVTEKTASLHQGLGVQKLPFAHIYTPDAGLVEELRITRPFFTDFAQKLRSYMVGECELKNGEVLSPYASASVESSQTNTANK